MSMKIPALGASLLIAAAVIVGCNGNADNSTGTGSTTNGDSKLTGSINIDGSGTVYPIAEAVVDEFKGKNGGVKITVNKAGTGSGMQKFSRGEIDIADASRPIEAKEVAALKAANIEFIEVPIAFDGLSIVANASNTWADKLTLDELKRTWMPDSKVKTWADIRPGWPAEKISLYGPTTNHGTFEYFTEAIVGKANSQRTDYQPNQEYNALIQGVSSDKDSLGYVGYSYYAQNKDKLKLVAVDSGAGPITPSVETIADGSYKPLSRVLFMYVSKKALAKPEVKAFLDYILTDGREIISSPEVGYVQLPGESYDKIKADVDAGTTGTRFQGVVPGTKLADVLAKAPKN